MAGQSRQTKIFAALLISMGVGAIALMILGNNPPSAGAFCLSRYYCLDPVEKVVLSEAEQYRDRWDNIEIYCGGAEAGKMKRLASQSKVGSGEDINCHFVIFADAGSDGQIQSTESWQRQRSVSPGLSFRGSERAIRICILCDKETFRPTEFQRRRTEALVEELCRKFEIKPEYIHYPDGW
jgi:hypothetical protein